MKKNIVMLTIMAIMMAVSSTALAKTPVTVEGTFEGAMCAFYGNACPMEPTEAHIALEPDFVLRTKGGENHYVVNLDRSTKVRYVKDKVRISGKVNAEGTLFAERLDVYKGSKYVKVWDLVQQEAERKRFIESGGN